jgi:cob(I)alamin adenosyltransferase
MDNMTLALAKKISDYAEELVEKEYENNPFSIAIVDKNGFTVLYHKQDDAKLLTINLTPAKAYTAARMGQTTAAFLTRLQKENLNIRYFADNKFVAMPGGVPIRNAHNKIIGAIGIGGLKKDGEVAERIVVDMHL